MPGIHPASRKQVLLAFAMEARGKFPSGIAREWAHRWKCWTWDESVRGRLPKDCKDAYDLLEKIRREHPTWKIPRGVVPTEKRRLHGRVVKIFPKKPKAPRHKIKVPRRKVA
jgi:hypothetical protein